MIVPFETSFAPIEYAIRKDTAKVRPKIVVGSIMMDR